MMQSYTERFAQITGNGIFKMDVGKKMHGHGVQTPRISIKYSITVKAERDREERPDRWKWKKSPIYIYIYRYESIKATILH